MAAASPPTAKADGAEHVEWESLLTFVADCSPTSGSPHPLGLELTEDDAGRWNVTVVNLDTLPHPIRMSATLNSTAEVLQLGEMDGSVRVRWVADDLTSTATALAQAGVNLRYGMCLSLAQRALDASDGVLPESVPTEPVDLATRFRQVQQRIQTSRHAAQLTLLTELDSASALAAADMTAAGIPWDVHRYRSIITDTLGTPTDSDPYPLRTELDNQIAECLGGARFRWSTELPDAFDGEGIPLPSSQISDLQAHDHPAVPLILRWRQLDTLATRHGYDWANQWTRNGRWYPRFTPVGTASGRWTGEGGALQLPHSLHACVRAQDGRSLVAADLSQLEPRIWAHLSQDPELLAAAAHGDLYHAAAQHLSVERPEAKVAVLAALYGQRTGTGQQVANILNRAFPHAMALIADTAARGRRGELVRTWLGRTSPPPDHEVRDALATPRDQRSRQQRAALARRGRELANHVIQGTAAEVACSILAALRQQLRALNARVALFVHDEFVVDTASNQIDDVQDAIRTAVLIGSSRVLGDSRVDLPVTIGYGPDWATARS